jgi:hypothetical protein
VSDSHRLHGQALVSRRFLWTPLQNWLSAPEIQWQSRGEMTNLTGCQRETPAVAYGHAEAGASVGPVISGCELAPGSSKLILKFNRSLLRGETVRFKGCEFWPPSRVIRFRTFAPP